MDPFGTASRKFDSLSLPQGAALTPTGPQQSRKETAPSLVSPQKTMYPPQALLNPKAAAGSSSRATADEADDAANGQVGASSLYERLNNVTAREHAPSSKRKAQVVEDGESDGERKKSKSTFSQPSAGGILSDHMKEERAKMAGPAETIDLTNDDDDVQVVSANDPQREVCLGILNSSANVYQVPHPGNNKGFGKTAWPMFNAKIIEGNAERNRIELADKSGKRFGMVEPKLASAMAGILVGNYTNKTRFKVMIASRTRKPDEQIGQKVSLSLSILVAMFAPYEKADALGKYLSQKQLFLATPMVDPGREVYNPQGPKNFSPATKVVPKPQFAGASVQRSAEEIRREASQIFDRLDTADIIPEMEPQSGLITSELMGHQKQALHFLTQHERDDFNEAENPALLLWKYRPKNNGQPAWYNIITNIEVYKVPKPVRGGILADVMGLGKTLSILSLIAETREAAKSFRRRDVPGDTDAELNSQATLIICPKSVLSNWQEQIKTHTAAGHLKTYIYHGANRTQDLRFLSKHDIILTSYNTAAAEFGARLRKNRALCSINWFRVVLDEAHSIRNQSTQVSKACCALNAERRWAVTGTPVQNTLLDLGALVRFIRLKPLDEPTAWSQYMMAPFKMGDDHVLANLQILVRSVTLRRSKNTIDLPDREEIRDRLEFSKEEEILYRQFATKCRSQFHQVTGGGTALKGRAYAHVLKSLGRLRAICAHGREMLTEDDMKDIEGNDPNNAIVLDLGDEMEAEDGFLTEKQAYDHFYMTQESEVDKCETCGNKLGSEKAVRADGAIDLNSDDDDDNSGPVEQDEPEERVDEPHDLLGHVTPCYHLICTKCTEKHKAEAQSLMAPDRYYDCPYCQQYQRFGMYPILRSVLERYKEERRSGSNKAKGARWDDSTYTGPHTKVKALLEDLRKSAEETEQLPEGEPPIRSVVFSGWTTYLDLIEHALIRHDIGFARIDGSMSVKERSSNLKAFNELPEFTVLLVSIKAGGQGLNFTAANKAYVMEPQFNPGVEAQAVDRVHRIGQTRKVTIKHYIMKESVEEGILKLQVKKEKLAQLSMDKSKSKSEEAKERMQELKDLFK